MGQISAGIIDENVKINLKPAAILTIMGFLITIMGFLIIQTISLTSYVISTRFENARRDEEISKRVTFETYNRNRAVDSLIAIQVREQSEENGKKLDNILYYIEKREGQRK